MEKLTTEKLAAESSVQVTCPSCYEVFLIRLEADVEGTLAVDCEVCCRPIELVVSHDPHGQALADVRPLER